MVYESVKKAFFEIMGFEDSEIALESNLYDELDVDSLDMAQIILALENEYKISIDDTEIEFFKTIEDIVKNVESKID